MTEFPKPKCSRCAAVLPPDGIYKRLVRYDRRNRYEKFCGSCAACIDDTNRLRYAMKLARPVSPR